MSTKHIKTEMGLFDFNDLVEAIQAPILHKAKKKKERVPFYIEAFDNFGKSLNIETTDTNTLNTDVEAIIGPPDEVEDSLEESKAIFEKNEIIYNNNLELRKDAQLSKPKQPSEGSYESIWKKPRIRPNVDFEEEMDLDEMVDFDEEEEEEEDCAIVEPSIRINRHTYSKYSTQPTTQPSSVPEESQEEVPEKRLMSKVENIKFWGTPITTEKATKMHEDIGSLYCTKEESITDNEA